MPPDLPHRAIRLVCIDVDGTLVGSRGEPTEGVWAAAHAARERGIHLAICTARIAIGSAWAWATRLDPDGWHLFQTGASMVHTASKQIRSTPLPDGALIACANIATERNWILEAYGDFSYVVDDERPAAVAHAALLGVEFERLPLSALTEEAVRAQYIVTDNDVEAARRAVPRGCTASAATSPVMPGWNFVSITDERVSKAEAIRRLTAVLSLSIDQVMMVGDGQNDVPALEAAGFAVAMGNAHPDAVAVSNRQVVDVEEDGLAEALDLARLSNG